MPFRKNEVPELYEKMLLIRRFEENCGRLYMEGKIRGFLHLYIGEEAIAVGSISALREDDFVISHYRDHGHALSRGMEPQIVMAELMGKVTGSSGGKGGSMHLFDISKRFMGGYAIVGGQLPIAAGLGLSLKYKKQDAAVLCFFGDGAVNEGEFHEALNLASLWKLPVLFFLENNLYGMGTSVEKSHAAGNDLYLKANAYKIPSAQIDGMNVSKVRLHTEQALQAIRGGEGPVFIEALTYRYKGHSVADPSNYRNEKEVKEWESKDPIVLFRDQSLADGLMAQDDVDLIAERVDSIVAEAVKFAEASEDPPPEALYENVYL